MRRSLLPLVAAALVASPATAQDPTPAATERFVGVWQGALPIGARSLRIAFEVRRDSAGALTGASVSIDQGGARIPATYVVRGDTLVAAMAAVNASFTGAITAAGDTLRGTFTQGPNALPLVLARVAAVPVAELPPRPQDPKPPFPYRAVDVAFEAAPGVTLAGTLTVPEGSGRFPGVVLVSGSGPQDRDETLMGHKPFRVLADHLARRGIAVLRYDDRGVGQSTGDFARATSADFAADAEAAVRFLRGRSEIAGDRVGIVGHSEGGLVGPLVAVRSRDVAFLVLLAGPGLPGDSILHLQNRLIQAASGVPPATIDRAVAMNARLFAAVKGARDSADAAARLAAVRREAVAALPDADRAAADAAIAQAIPTLLGPWMRYFLSYDPRPTLRRVRIPVLALNGTLDLQVPHRPNLAAIDSALAAARNRDYTVTALPNLNHLFQTARTGAPAEYQSIGETFAPAALEAVSSWIVARFAGRR